MSLVVHGQNGYTFEAIEGNEQVDFTEVTNVSDAAWKADYNGQPRFVYDENYYRWLLSGNDWKATFARGANGSLVAIVFSFFRQLSYRGKTYPALYSTGLAVVPGSRGSGLSKQVQAIHRERLFAQYGRVVGFAMLQLGHGGLPSVSSAVKKNVGIQLANFYKGYLWSRRLTKIPLETKSQEFDVSLSQDLVNGTSDNRDGSRPALSLRKALRSALPGRSLHFKVTESFERMYLDSADRRSGTIFFSVPGESLCAICYSIVDVALDQHLLGSLGQLQMVHYLNCGLDRITSFLRHACHLFGQWGCFAVSIVDQGAIDQRALTAAGFQITNDQLMFSLRGTEEVMQEFDNLEPPFAVDFL